MSTGRSLLFAAILGVYLVAGILYVWLTPAWQTPDEPAHYNYMRYIATHTGFPELVSGCYDEAYLNALKSRRFPPDMSVDLICYEYHQPPLYYLMGMPVFILSQGSLTAIRLFSVFLGAGVVTLAFFIGSTIFPDRPAIAYGTMAFVAFVPMHVAILSSVNNDSLAELILATILFVLTRRLLIPHTQTTQNDLLLGALLGIGFITKTTVYISVPLVALGLFLGNNKFANWRLLLKQALLIYGLALIIALPWYVRNINLYGRFDILGLSRHDDVVIGQLRTAKHIATVGPLAYIHGFITTTFNSFWGQFGWMAVPMDGRTYHLLVIILLIVCGGLIAFFFFSKNNVNQLTRPQKKTLWLMVATILLTALGYAWYNLSFVQFQGRYLFPALIPVGLFFSLGLLEALSRRWLWGLLGFLGVVLVWAIGSGWLQGDVDKWIIIILGAAIVALMARLALSRYDNTLLAGLFIAVYAGLAFLTIVGPYWFISPYL